MLCYYDEEQEPPEAATCLGKAELGKITGVARKGPRTLQISFSTRAVAWDLDAGSESRRVGSLRRRRVGDFLRGVEGRLRGEKGHQPERWHGREQPPDGSEQGDDVEGVLNVQRATQVA